VKTAQDIYTVRQTFHFHLHNNFVKPCSTLITVGVQSTWPPSVLSAFPVTTAPHPTLSPQRLSNYTRPCVCRKPTSRVNYFRSLLIAAPKKSTDKLQRVLNVASRIVSNTRKYDRRLPQFRRSELHWRWMSSIGSGSDNVSKCSSVCII